MTAYQLSMLSVVSGSCPLITVLFKAEQIPKSYLPFTLFLLAGVINDGAGLLLIQQQGSNLTLSNTYVLLEYMILLYQFFCWNSKLLPICLIAAILVFLVWGLDNLWMNRLAENNSIFRITYSCVIVLFSINRLNREVIWEQKQLFTNPTFLLCLSFTLYYGLKAFFESFNLYHLYTSSYFYSHLWMILNIVNIAVNIMYSYVILCFRPRTIFTLH